VMLPKRKIEGGTNVEKEMNWRRFSISNKTIVAILWKQT
jgi:hypothetical protein